MSSTAPAPASGPPAGPRGISVRLVIAIVVASLLATFAVYIALAGNGTPLIGVAQAAEGQHLGKRVSLAGTVSSSTGTGSDSSALVITLRDDDPKKGGRTVRVVYQGAVPDAYATGRHIVVDGSYDGKTFRGISGTLLTKCPSKYQDDTASTASTKG